MGAWVGGCRRKAHAGAERGAPSNNRVGGSARRRHRCSSTTLTLALTLTLTTDLNPNPNPNQPSYGAPPPTWGAAQNSGQNAALRRLAEKDPWEVHPDRARTCTLTRALP